MTKETNTDTVDKKEERKVKPRKKGVLVGLMFGSLLLSTGVTAGAYNSLLNQSEKELVEVKQQLVDKDEALRNAQKLNAELTTKYETDLKVATDELALLSKDKTKIEKDFADKDITKEEALLKYQKKMVKVNKKKQELEKTKKNLESKLTELKEDKEKLEKKNKKLKKELAVKEEKRILKLANKMEEKEAEKRLKELAREKSSVNLDNDDDIFDDEVPTNEETVVNYAVDLDTSKYEEEEPEKEKVNRPRVESTETVDDYEVVDTLTMQATAYVADCPGCSGITATGVDVRTKTPNIIAVDPRVIPLHTKVAIYTNGKLKGVYKAEDTGGAIKGNIIDILVPNISEAYSWGRRVVTVKVLK